MTDLRTTDRTTIAAAFARALVAGDRDGLRSLLADDVRLDAITPSRTWEADDADGVIDTVLGRWFGGGNRITGLLSSSVDLVGDVVRVGYRFRAEQAEGPAVVEQQAYLETDGEVIRRLRVVCSGYHQVR